MAMTIVELAQATGVSVATIRRRSKEKKVPHTKDVNGQFIYDAVPAMAAIFFLYGNKRRNTFKIPYHDVDVALAKLKDAQTKDTEGGSEPEAEADKVTVK